jgi:urease accessory protein
MDEMLARFPDANLVFLESGGDNLTLTFSPTLVDAYIFVIDVAEGDDIPRKKGPGITHSDLLVINKVDLAPYVRVNLDVMRAGAQAARPDGAPWVMTNSLTGDGLDQVMDFIATTSRTGRSDGVSQLLEALPAHDHSHDHLHAH